MLNGSFVIMPLYSLMMWMEEKPPDMDSSRTAARK
jgi:hypothetical protein